GVCDSAACRVGRVAAALIYFAKPSQGRILRARLGGPPYVISERGRLRSTSDSANSQASCSPKPSLRNCSKRQRETHSPSSAHTTVGWCSAKVDTRSCLSSVRLIPYLLKRLSSGLVVSRS